MSNTKIEWAEKTWNPITGCTKISEGCKNCYAEKMSKRLAGRYGYPKYNPFAVTFHEDKLEEPLKWKKPSMVFVCSMGDLFHDDVDFELQNKIFSIIRKCSQHTFLILTKRPEKMRDFLKCYRACGEYHITYKNVWLGVTVENQEQADKRIPILLEIPATKRFVSIEPMLEEVDLNCVPFPDNWRDKDDWVSDGIDPLRFTKSHIEWVICGGETGQNARKIQTEWVRSLRDQCQVANVPFFFKKMGQGKETPPDLMIREYPI